LIAILAIPKPISQDIECAVNYMQARSSLVDPASPYWVAASRPCGTLCMEVVAPVT